MTGGTNQVALGHSIRKFYKECVRNPEGRYRSWDHCHGFFRQHYSDLQGVQDTAALQLGFYLASWGMSRGSSFLLQHTYLVHLPVIHLVAQSRFSNLWDLDCRTHDQAVKLGQTIMELVEAVRDGYRQVGREPTDVLVTKVLLGTVGCLPAYDRFFRQG